MSQADRCGARSVVLVLLMAAVSSCTADSGALAKPVVFESSAKRAAAAISVRGQGTASAGAAAQAPTQSQPGSAPASSSVTAAAAGANAATGSKAAAAGSGSTAPTSSSMSQRSAAGAAATQPAERGNAAGAGAPPNTTGSSMASAAGAGAAAMSGGATPCTMHVTYSAVGMHGMWYPHNIGAVWVEDANGKFVKTLERWAGIRAGYLENWNKREDQHGSWPSCPFANVCTGPKVPDQMDVMTQATIFEDNAMHTAMWSCKNIDGQVVPDGKYKLFFEEMENISPAFPSGPLGMVEFEKTPEGMTLMPPDQPPYKNLKIVIEPGAH